MKKILLTFIAISLMMSCDNSKKESSSTSTLVLSGNFQNSNSTTIRFGNEIYNTEIKLDSNGSFKKELNIKAGKYFVITDDKQVVFNIYLPKSGEIGFTIDANKFKENRTAKALKFSGEAKTFNEYLLTGGKSVLSTLGFEAFMKEETDFIKTVDSVVVVAKQTLENYPNLPNNLKTLELKDIEYSKYEALISYEEYHRYITANQNFKNSSEDMKIEKVISSIDLSNEEEFNFSSSYRNLIMTYCDFSYNKGGGDESSFIKIASENLTNKYILNYIIYNQIMTRLSSSKDPKTYYDNYMAVSTDIKQKEEITKIYDGIKNLMPGNPSPEFTNYENHAGGKSSLSDFKGKYVYIDVWATWCGPCIQEIPSFEKLKQVYKGKNIEFMSISIDSKKDHNKWKDMVTERDLKGTQLLADNEWKSQFIKDYLIQGIPRFILIDPNGNIMNHDAPRPSNPKVKELLDSLSI